MLVASGKIDTDMPISLHYTLPRMYLAPFTVGILTSLMLLGQITDRQPGSSKGKTIRWPGKCFGEAGDLSRNAFYSYLKISQGDLA